MKKRLAIVTSHPIQYYAPWFRCLAAELTLDLRVFYLWNFGVTPQHDPGFKTVLEWDIPLLDGYAHEFVPNHSSRPGTDHFWGLWNPSLLSRVREFHPDAVLLIGYNYAGMLGFIARTGSLPLIFRGDSHRLAAASSPLKTALIRAIYQRFAAFLPVGQANTDYFRAHGVPAQKMFLCPHCVDNDRFAAPPSIDFRKTWGISPEEHVILFVGKLEPKKRPLDLLASFQTAALPGATLVFVGSGDAALCRQIQGQNVRVIPFQNQSNMPSVYAAADLLVLPSEGNGETWGLVVNEAMAAGKPVIVSSHVGCGPDLVLPGKTGWIFPAGDSLGLARCLTEALSDPPRLREMGRQAQRRVKAEFSYAHATQGLLQALDFVSARS